MQRESRMPQLRHRVIASSRHPAIIALEFRQSSSGVFPRGVRACRLTKLGFLSPSLCREKWKTMSGMPGLPAGRRCNRAPSDVLQASLSSEGVRAPSG